MDETANDNAAPPAGAEVSERPPWVPEKFWDEASGSIRLEDAFRSYGELERKLGQKATLPDGEISDEQRQKLLDLLGRPGSADDYRIEPPHALIEPDADLNKRLHEAGFSQTQAQLVYELAAERLLPVVGEMVSEVEARRESERLERHFGGADAWGQTSRQLRTWADANLEPAVRGALGASFEGVLALYQLMKAAEPKLLDVDGDGRLGPSEENLQQMMRDPRYWRDRDSEFVARVTDGFRRLYPT